MSQAASQAVSIVARLPTAVPAAEMKTYWAMNARDWPGNPNRPRDLVAESAKVPIGYILLKSGDGAVVGGCYWIEREIQVGGRPERVVGLAGVLVAEEWRGQGHGRRLVEAASEWAAREQYKVGVLFCVEGNVAFYEKLGWERLQSEVIVHRHGEAQSLWPGNLIMARSLSSQPLWKAAQVDVGAGQW